jgi:hypothetical protein
MEMIILGHLLRESVQLSRVRHRKGKKARLCELSDILIGRAAGVQ